MTKLIPSVLRTLSRDGWLLFVTRFARLFAYGSLSVILVFYLVGLGLSEAQVGLVLTLTLFGDVIVSLYLTTRADRIGRRRMLIVGSILMAAAGLAFATTSNLIFLVIAGTIGVISPSGNEVGPFLSVEQAPLSHIVPAAARSEVFAWYTLAGSLATALGALCGGGLVQALEHTAITHVQSYRAVVFLYAALGAALAFLFLRLSTSVEVSPASNSPAPSSSLASIWELPARETSF
jgi:MFS family permease